MPLRQQVKKGGCKLNCHHLRRIKQCMLIKLVNSRFNMPLKVCFFCSSPGRCLIFPESGAESVHRIFDFVRLPCSQSYGARTRVWRLSKLYCNEPIISLVTRCSSSYSISASWPSDISTYIDVQTLRYHSETKCSNNPINAIFTVIKL